MKTQFYRNFQVFSGNTDSEAVVYNKLPIIPLALMASESIAHSGSRNNC